jgi:hypothetical protein
MNHVKLTRRAELLDNLIIELYALKHFLEQRKEALDNEEINVLWSDIAKAEHELNIINETLSTSKE